MKSFLTRSLTVSFAVAAAIAMPTAVKAQANNLAATAFTTTAGETPISTETNWCVYIPGYGIVGPTCPR